MQDPGSFTSGIPVVQEHGWAPRTDIDGGGKSLPSPALDGWRMTDHGRFTSGVPVVQEHGWAPKADIDGGGKSLPLPALDGWRMTEPGCFTSGVPVVQEHGWAPRSMWTDAENLAPYRRSIPGPSRPKRFVMPTALSRSIINSNNRDKKYVPT